MKRMLTKNQRPRELSSTNIKQQKDFVLHTMVSQTLLPMDISLKICKRPLFKMKREDSKATINKIRSPKMNTGSYIRTQKNILISQIRIIFMFKELS